MKLKLIITFIVLSVILIAVGLIWRDNRAEMRSSGLGGTADIIQEISIDKTEICSGEDVFISVEVSSLESSQGDVFVYINNQLGNPQHIGFTGAPGQRTIQITAATREQEFDTEEITIEVVDCSEEEEFLQVSISPNPYQEHMVDFRITNAELFIDQDPIYVWNFGDGQSLQTTDAYTQHSYEPAISVEQPYFIFQASVTLQRAGYEDLTAHETITLWNTYTPSEQQAYIQPQVNSDRYLERSGDNWEGDYTIKNKGDEPIEFISSQATIHPCDPEGKPTAFPQESADFSVNSQRKITSNFTISADQIGDDYCTLEIMLSGQTESDQPVYANVYFDLQPNPLMLKPVKNTAMLQLLNLIVDKSWVDDPFNISEEDLYRLEQEGKITYPPMASSESSSKVTPKQLFQPNNMIGQPCQPGEEPPPGAGTYDDDDDWINYSGFWQQASPIIGPYNDTITYSDSVGNSGTYTFNGSEVTLVYTMAGSYGTMDVSIDGVPVNTIDMFNPTFLYQQEWTSGALSPGIHTITFEHASGFAVEVDAFIVTGPSQPVSCQATGNWIFSPPFIANARKGDVILSAGCGLVGNMLRQLVPPQLYSHTGIMTQDYYQITHSTASEERYEDHLVGWEDTEGFNESVLRWGWPGVITQSVDEAFNGEWISDVGKAYWMVGFHSYPVQCQGDNQLVWPMVVKPPPDAPPIVREYLHKVADKALTSSGHYRFYVYSNANIVFDGAYDDPNGKPATVCSQFVWYNVMQVNAENTTQIILEGNTLEANDIANGAEIEPGTPDGLYTYREAERLSAAWSLYNYIYEKAMDAGHGFCLFINCEAMARKYGNQFTNCFANDDCTSNNTSIAWQNPGEGEAVSPDDILFWDDWSTVQGPNQIGVYGYSEPLAYRSGEYVAETLWQYGGLEGDVEGNVLYQGNPVEGASVTISNLEVFTDANGEFVVPNITAGEYEITASQYIAGAYMSERQFLEIKPGETTTVELTLKEPIGTIRVFIKGATFVLDDEAFQGDETRLCEFQTAPVLDPFLRDLRVDVDSCCAGDEVRIESQFYLHLESQVPYLFDVGTQYIVELDQRLFSNALRQEFVNHGISLSDDVIIEIGEVSDPFDWRVFDKDLYLFFNVINLGGVLRIEEEIFSDDVTVTNHYQLYEGTECSDNDLDGHGMWGPVTIPMGQWALLETMVENDDPWEPDWSWSNQYYVIQNSPDVLSGIVDLAVEKDDGGVSVFPGDTITYYLTYSNNGDHEATGVELLETVPPHTTFNPAASSPGWTCQPDNNAGSQCTINVGTVEIASIYEPVEFAVKVDNPPPASVDLVVNIASIRDDGSYGAEAYPLDNMSIDQTTILPDITPPQVVSVSPTGRIDNGPNRLVIVFSEEMKHGDSSDPDDVTNPANYLMVWAGKDGKFQSSTCNHVLAGSDMLIPVGPVSYDNSLYTAIVSVPGGKNLREGYYRVFLCGTSTIMDPSGNPLLGGEDYIFDFNVGPAKGRGGIAGLPDTGFQPDEIAVLPYQALEKKYANYNSEIWLEIPRLNVNIPIVGVPEVNGEWDVTWLGSNAGYLEGTAFPTWTGNTGITAHVWDANNNPGPFAQLKDLQHGDLVFIHAWGLVYTYEVRFNYQVAADNMYPLRHQEHDWVTLVTCELYSESSSSYRYRRVVRAVLVDVSAE